MCSSNSCSSSRRSVTSCATNIPSAPALCSRTLACVGLAAKCLLAIQARHAWMLTAASLACFIVDEFIVDSLVIISFLRNSPPPAVAAPLQSMAACYPLPAWQLRRRVSCVLMCWWMPAGHVQQTSGRRCSGMYLQLGARVLVARTCWVLPGCQPTFKVLGQDASTPCRRRQRVCLIGAGQVCLSTPYFRFRQCC
jgi:hypothetical protein